MMPPRLMHGFLRAQFTYLFRTFPLRRTWRHKLWILAEAVQLLVRYGWLTISLRFGGGSGAIGGKTCAVVLLTHSRPQNLPLLVRGALSNQFVTKVLVSNSNQEVRIAEWIKVQDPRLVLTDEAQRTQPGHRLVLARKTGAEHILAIDDDIFFSPAQWKNFFRLLLADDQCPHGIIGQVYRPGTTSSNGSPFHHVVGRETDVDVLIGAYAFTSEHLRRVFEVATKVGISDLSQVRNYDDVLLSFGGIKRPHIHPLKPALICASASLPGVAMWTSNPGFWDERIRVFEAARDARLEMNSHWAHGPQFAKEERRS
jgi:hypothetical protein